MNNSRSLTSPHSINDDAFLAVRPEFVLKIDGNRPIIYPLDYNNTQILFLSPEEGLVLSLLNGKRPFFRIKHIFNNLFPHVDTSLVERIIVELEQVARNHPSVSGMGSDGIISFSHSPIDEAIQYNPREFIISSADFNTRMTDCRTMRRLETPVNIYTVFTHKCFTRCAYCYAEKRKVEEMPLSRWHEIIQEMEELGIILAAPDNGDTFARPEGVAFIECLLEHGMHFLLSTKAHLSKQDVKRLVQAGLAKKIRGVITRNVQLSIDAIDLDISRKILNVRRSRLPGTIDTFDNFMAFGIMPIIKAVITGLNCSEPIKIVDAFYPRGARTFSFVRYTRSFHRHTDSLFVNQSCLPILSTQMQEIREKYPDINLEENLTRGGVDAQDLTTPERQRVWNNRIGCGGGWYALGIAADGRAFLCEQMVQDPPYIIGDAREQSIAEIWESDEMKRFIYPEQDLFSGTICGDCDEFDKCMYKQGRCYRDAFFSYGTIYTSPPLCPKNEIPGLRLS